MRYGALQLWGSNPMQLIELTRISGCLAASWEFVCIELVDFAIKLLDKRLDQL